MNEQWKELKETIIELRDNDGTGTQQEVCKFLANLMDVLEKGESLINGDAISRQAVLDLLENTNNGWIINKVLQLPPVTPQQKMGHWIETAEEYYKAINERGGGVNENTPYFTYDIACSECLAKFSVIDNETERFKCCPNCGAKMQEVEE